MRRIQLIIFSISILGGCSAEYSVGKIMVIDETQSSTKIDISETAERLLKELKNIRTGDPANSNSTLKITISETNSMRETGRGRNRYHISLLLTATFKDGNIQIFQSDSTSNSEINKVDPDSQIKILLYDSLLKIDYQCTIRKREEQNLFKIFADKKTSKWQRETIIDEISNRLTTNNVKDIQSVYNFLFQTFTTKKSDFGEKIIGILSSTDISRFNLNDTQKELLTKELIRYSLGKEAHIQIHVITILSKLKNDIAKSYIFTLSTGSTIKSVQSHAKEVLNELNKNNTNTNHTITSK